MTPGPTDRFFETILDSVADGVFTVGRDWRITSFNRAAERITGIPAARAIGRPCSEVFHADICESRCALRRSMETGQELIDLPARILDARGRSIPISLSTAVLRDSGGELLGAVETFRDLSALERLRKEISHEYSYEDIVGKSRGLKKIFAILPDVAESDATVLIEGTSGTGKELLARALHNLSRRRKRPFVAVNCGALPVSLFESELFGHTKGAFTDARRDKPGRLALAEGGTLFLDEVSELPPATQVKLLRVLQEREYEALGGVKTLRADVRVVAATNQRLVELVSEGRFRDDLYFRLAVVRLAIPPLKERREDVPLLVSHFIERFDAQHGRGIHGVTPRVMEILMRHDFPGNVRELENIIEHGFVLCHDPEIDVQHLPEELRSAAPHRVGEQDRRSNLARAEADALRGTLEQHQGRMIEAAHDLGISRTTLWRKLKEHGIVAAEFKSERGRPGIDQGADT